MKRIFLAALLMAGVLFAGQIVNVGETFVPNEPDGEPSEPAPEPEPEPVPEPEDEGSPSIGPFGSEVGMEPAGSEGAEPEAYSGETSGASGQAPTPAPCIAGFALLALAAYALRA